MSNRGPANPLGPSAEHETPDAARSRILRPELERRLRFLDETDDSVFGRFTAVDWAVCTILSFVLPLVIVWLAA